MFYIKLVVLEHMEQLSPTALILAKLIFFFRRFFICFCYNIDV